jgi:uncharacterized integral membrane protein (TIGR00697 family)
MATSNPPQRHYKYLDFVMAGFVAVLLCSNLIGAGKVVSIGGFVFGCGNLFFPLSYLFGDVLTEVYGYSASRRVVWAGFGALIFASIMSQIILLLPPAPGWDHQAAIETIFGATPRVVIGSMIAYFCGEFTNSFVLAKMKIATQGRWLFLRTIGSTVVGEAVDSVIFYPLAFWGVFADELVIQMALGSYAIKVGWEIVATPITYRVVSWLKRNENEDFYDLKTKFSPFSIS